MSCDKLSRLVAIISTEGALDDPVAIVQTIASETGFIDAAYYRLTLFGEPMLPTFIFGSSFDDWISIYIERGYSWHDPVVELAFRHDIPFTAREVAERHPQPAALHADRLTLWAPDGLFCPISSSFGEVGVIGWRSATVVDLNDADRMAMRLLSAALVVSYKRQHADPIMPDLAIQPFSRRESECIYWMGQAKSTGEIATILGLSTHTVRQYLDSAVEKVGAKNRAQLLLRASVLGLVAAHG